MLYDHVSSLCNSASVLAEEPSPCFREYMIMYVCIYLIIFVMLSSSDSSVLGQSKENAGRFAVCGRICSSSERNAFTKSRAIQTATSNSKQTTWNLQRCLEASGLVQSSVAQQKMNRKVWTGVWETRVFDPETASDDKFSNCKSCMFETRSRMSEWIGRCKASRLQDREPSNQ